MGIYAGVGARSTPQHVLSLMTKIAKGFAWRHWALSSGGAKGADAAFELGARLGDGNVRIFTAQHAPDDIQDHRYPYSIARQAHPAWDNCNDHVKRLHARNVLILLGRDLVLRAEFVICWTPMGRVIGGTGLTIRVADMFGIPVFNLADAQFSDLSDAKHEGYLFELFLSLSTTAHQASAIQQDSTHK